jgi:hypothetical protein
MCHWQRKDRKGVGWGKKVKTLGAKVACRVKRVWWRRGNCMAVWWYRSGTMELILQGEGKGLRWEGGSANSRNSFKEVKHEGTTSYLRPSSSSCHIGPRPTILECIPSRWTNFVVFATISSVNVRPSWMPRRTPRFVSAATTMPQVSIHS